MLPKSLVDSRMEAVVRAAMLLPHVSPNSSRLPVENLAIPRTRREMELDGDVKLLPLGEGVLYLTKDLLSTDG